MTSTQQPSLSASLSHSNAWSTTNLAACLRRCCHHESISASNELDSGLHQLLLLLAQSKTKSSTVSAAGVLSLCLRGLVHLVHAKPCFVCYNVMSLPELALFMTIRYLGQHRNATHQLYSFVYSSDMVCISLHLPLTTDSQHRTHRQPRHCRAHTTPKQQNPLPSLCDQLQLLLLLVPPRINNVQASAASVDMTQLLLPCSVSSLCA